MKTNQRISRYIAIGVSLTLVANIVGCGGGNNAGSSPRPDIILSGSENELANVVKSQYNILTDLARNPGKAKIIQVGEGAVSELLSLSFAKNDAGNYEHPRFVRLKTGEAGNLVWGFSGIIPTIKITDDNGNTLKADGVPVEYPLEISTKSRDISEIVVIGMKAAAIAFVIWLSAGITRAVLAAIGFIAFNAMVIGLIIASAAILIPIAEMILNYLGINSMEDVKRIFQSAVSDIAQTLKDLTNLLRVIIVRYDGDKIYLNVAVSVEE